jgi:hypothetical protein
MLRKFAARWALLMCLSSPVLAAELFYMDHDSFSGKYVGPVGPLVFSGEIEPGDYDRLLAKILDDQSRFLAENKILLASDGGDVAEATKIATLMKSMLSEVIVGTQTGRCVSACFLIFAAAQQRGVEGDRLIGINRPYIVDPDAPTAVPANDSLDDPASLAKVRVFLQENEVPADLIDEMFRHPSDDAYWLTADDEKRLGSVSRALTQMLVARCAWDPSLEREVFAGHKPREDLISMWKCRTSAVRAETQLALAAAVKERSTRSAPQKTPQPPTKRPKQKK